MLRHWQALRLLLLVVACLSLPSLTLTSSDVNAPPSPVLRVVSSISSDPAIRLTPQSPVPFTLQPPPSGVPTLSFDVQQRFQSMEMGFGGAFTQAAGSQFVKLPSSLQAELIRAYFHPTEGHGYNIGRVPINSCDYSAVQYSYDDTPDDFDLKSFDRSAKVDSASIIPFIQAAQRLTGESLLLFAAPWSPPAWMKLSGQMNGSSTPCLKEDPRVHRAWALYFVEWLRVYQARNISFWGLRSPHPAHAPHAQRTQHPASRRRTTHRCSACCVGCAVYRMSRSTTHLGRAASSARSSR